jgi:DNA-directed RNA polymerase subunit H (RpoH/RPB5)
MSSLNLMVNDLRGHLALCEEILVLVEAESHALHHSESGPSFASYQAKKNLLPRLNQSLNQIRQHRATWQKLSPAERAQYPEVPGLLRQNQDLIMKIIVLDRENEQALLRQGLVPPRQLPSANRQRPHFVADLYRRQGR